VINVWGSWCPPVSQGAPDLQAASVETKECRLSSSASPARTTIQHRRRRSFRSFEITYPSIYDPSGKVLLAFSGDFRRARSPRP
jgi:hypothetical protein